jgi:hypothetical protein
MKFLKIIRRFWTHTWRRAWNELPSWVRVLAVLGILLGIGWMTARPAYARFRQWRLERNYQAALVADRAGRSSEARELARALILSGDRRVETLRVLERSLVALKDPRHEEVALWLFGHPSAGLEDRVRTFAVLAPESPYGRMRVLWSSLSEHERKDPRFMMPIADRMLADGAFGTVMQLLGAPSGDAHDPAAAERRIRAAIGVASPESCEDAQRWIVDAWKADPDSPLEVWLRLESIPVVELDDFLLEPMRAWLVQGRPGKPGRGECIDARIRWPLLAPAERGPFLDTLIARWKRDAPLALGKFLAAVGHDERLVEALDDPVVCEDDELVALRLEALQRLRRADDMVLTLLLQGRTLTPMWTQSWLAAASHVAGDTAIQADAWRAAIEEGQTSSEAGALIELNDFAVKAGMLEEHRSALVAAIKRGRGALPAYDQVKPFLKALEEQDSDDDLIAVHQRFVRLEPWNPALVNRYCHLAALSGLEDPAVLIGHLESVANQAPDLAQTSAVQATVHLLGGDVVRADECWKRLKLPVDELTVGFRAAHLATAVVAGRTPPDDASVVSFPWDELLSCERTAFRKIIDEVARENQRKAQEEKLAREQKAAPAAVPAATGASESGDTYLPPLPPVKAR